MKKAREYSSPLIDDLLNKVSEKELQRTKKRMQLASFIADAMESKGWKQKDLAKALGKSAPEISKYLSGTHNFTADTLMDISEVLGVDFVNLGDKPEGIITRIEVVVKSKDIKTDMSGLSDYSPYYTLFNNSKPSC